MPHQVVGGRSLVRKPGNSDAGADVGDVAFDQERAGQDFDHACGQRFGPVAVGQQDDELIAAQPGEQVVVPGFPAQTLRDQAQHGVADRMPRVSLIGLNRSRSIISTASAGFGRGVLHQIAQHFVEVPAVAQPGQRIEPGVAGGAVPAEAAAILPSSITSIQRRPPRPRTWRLMRRSRPSDTRRQVSGSAAIAASRSGRRRTPRSGRAAARQVGDAGADPAEQGVSTAIIGGDAEQAGSGFVPVQQPQVGIDHRDGQRQLRQHGVCQAGGHPRRRCAGPALGPGRRRGRLPVHPVHASPKLPAPRLLQKQPSCDQRYRQGLTEPLMPADFSCGLHPAWLSGSPTTGRRALTALAARVPAAAT